MRSFTKVILMLLLCTLGVLTTQAKTEKVHATFENPSNTNTSWNAETKTFTWSTTYYNQLRNIGLPTGDITKYKKLVVDCEIKSGDQFRILFYKGGSNLTLYAKNGVNEFVLADTLKVISPNDYNEYLLACDEICLSGNNAAAPGEAVINDVYLETYDDEGEKVYATFENPSNTNTTWNAETKTFTWSTTYYNQLRNIGLPSGDISVYKKLVVDCNIKSGDQFRILIYKGGSNLTLYAKDGVNEFILADTLKVISPNDYNEYLLACDEICLSGNNAAAPGEAVINAVYLETYPENESVEIPDIVYEEDPGKPEGEFVDFTEVFSTLQPRIGLGTDGHPIVLGNGDVVVGQRTKDVIADLSAYSKLTIVTSPKMKLVLYMNHEVDAQQNAGDYAETDAGKYVFMDVQADENGIIEVDLTQFDKQDLNCICLPWDNNNKGTVWYLLLTAKPAVAEPVVVTFDFNASNHATSNSGNEGDITVEEVNIVDGVAMTVTPNASGTANRYWNTNNGPQLRMYGGKMTIVAPEGKAITKAEINQGKWNADNTFNGEAAATSTWEGNSTNLVLAVAGNTQMNSVAVTIADKNNETTTYVTEPEPEPVHIANTAETAYDVAKAIELIEAGEALTDSVFVKGIISKIEKVNIDAEDATKSYITYWISADGTEEGQQFECYKGLSMEGLALDAIEVGAEVIVKGTLKKYGDIYELNSGNLLVSYKAPEAPVVDEDLVEIPQSQSPEIEDGATRAAVEEGEGYTQYTTDGGVCVIVKMYDVDVKDCDYVVVKFAEPVSAGVRAAFWAQSSQDNVEIPAGTTEYKYVFAEDEKCAIENGVLPQITLLTLWSAQTVKISGIYKHKAAVQPVEAPATPTFTPAAGEYFEAQTVAIACETEGAAIYYTLDGTAPTAESALYAEPIAIAETTTLKAIAIKDGVASEVAEAAYTISKPAIAEGKYYIYNVAAQGFIVGANNWGTRASISQTGGIEFEAVMADGKYELKSAPLYAGKHLGFNGYVDNGDLSNWTIAPVEGQEGVFTLSTDGTNVLFWDGGEATTTSVGAMPETAANAHWKFVTAEERLAAFANATAENPVDATFLIQNPNFSRAASSAVWTIVADNKNLAGGANENLCAESFHSLFTLSQVIANAPAGKYKMTAQGFYRQDGSDNDNLPVFYANDKTGTFPVKDGSENSMSDASASFSKGLYTIEPIEFTLFEDGQITIGAKLENNTNLWCIWDNFQLTYVTKDIPADEFEPAYTAALAAAKAAKDNESYAAVTGEEKTALEKAISDYETIAEPSADTYRAAISALTNATTAFTAAKADYEGLTAAKAAKAEFNFDAYAYAAAAKKAAAEATLTAEATSAADAKAKIGAIDKAFRQFVESNAMLEGVAGTARNCTDSIANPNAQEAIAEPWAVVKGEGSGGSLGILDGEPLTDGEGNSAYKYFDGGDWGASAWDVALEQTITLPAGKYLLTVAGRASADVDLNLFAGETTTKIAAIGAQGGLFGRGWGDASVEFEMAEAGDIKIGVRGVTSVVHNWMSFTRFRLVKFPAPEEDAPEVEVPEGWTNMIANGNLAGEGVESFFSKEANGATVNSTIVTMAGKDNSRGIVVKSADNPSQDWDTQFWIRLNEKLPSGAKLHVEFDYAASKAANASTQAHAEPGEYLHWAAIGDVNFTTEWKHFSADIEVSDAMAKGDNGNGSGTGMQSIAFNLAVEKTATEYYFDNFGVWAQQPKPVDEWIDLIVNGDMEGDDTQCFYVTEQGVGGPFVAITTAGIGKDGSKAVKVQSADDPDDPTTEDVVEGTDWDSQFFIRLPYQLSAGTKFKLSFDYKADKAGDFDTQSHAEPGQYIHWACAGSGSFTTEWQSYSFEGSVPAECDGSSAQKTFQTIAFNLAKNRVATEFIFDNVKFEIPADAAKTLNPAVNPTPYPVPEVAHTWNFTKWSEATVANLKADAAASKLEGWSDVEKKADAEADVDPTDISKDNCFWATIAEGGELTANGVVIEELKGLEFNATYSAARSLAIAVNYPSTSLGDYNGGAYLWLGGGGKDVDCFVIKNVKLGTEISMGVETHKIGDARGVQLFIRNADGSRGDMLKDPAGNEVAAPTAYAEQTWAVPAVEGADICDVIVYNTKGCHIYFIDAELGEGQTVGINTIAASKQFNGTIYNLRGQKMEKLQKGLNIVNGRKVVIK